jgi:hypothetical protein
MDKPARDSFAPGPDRGQKGNGYLPNNTSSIGLVTAFVRLPSPLKLSIAIKSREGEARRIRRGWSNPRAADWQRGFTQLQDAVIRNLEVIGEAAKQVSVAARGHFG